MTRYFGEPWNANIAKGEQVPAPIGAPCLHCQEPIQFEDSGLLMPGMTNGWRMPDPIHLECLLCTVYGSVSHQRGTCRCFGGSGEDDPALSKRENARRAVAEYEAMPLPDYLPARPSTGSSRRL